MSDILAFVFKGQCLHQNTVKDRADVIAASS